MPEKPNPRELTPKERVCDVVARQGVLDGYMPPYMASRHSTPPSTAANNARPSTLQRKTRKMPTPEVNNATRTDDLCRGCGACCAPGILGQGTAPYLEVTPDDLSDAFKSKTTLKVAGPLGLRYARYAAVSMYDDSRLFLPVVRGENDFTQCEHLHGIVLDDAGCSCYNTRPAACRVFEPGNAACQRLRQAWMVHRDKVAWKMKAKPQLTHDEAVYEVVNSTLDLFEAKHLGNMKDSRDDADQSKPIDSLGRGPDYVHLCHVREHEQRKKEYKKRLEEAKGPGDEDELKQEAVTDPSTIVTT